MNNKIIDYNQKLHVRQSVYCLYTKGTTACVS